MRKYLYLALAFLTVYACKPKNKKVEKPALAVSTNDSEGAKARKQAFEQIERYHQKHKFGFTFKSLNNCKEASELVLEEGPSDKLFDVVINVNDSLINIDFKFNSSCCQDFQGYKSVEDSVLILDYKPKTDEVCECRCTYRHVFEVKNQGYNSITLHDQIIWVSE